MSYRPTGGSVVSGGVIVPITPSTPGAGPGPTPPSTVPVWPLQLFPNLGIRRIFNNVVFDFGDGYEQRATKNQIYGDFHGDGTGAVTTGRGLWEFSISLNAINHISGDITQEVNKLWAFAIARLTSFEPFYFYNPIEAPAIDPTGASTVGRYFVRFKDNIVTLENFILRLHRGTLTLIEVRP